MLITEGTKVRVINTGDTGVVIELLTDDMVNVLLDNDDMEIPIAYENLERLTESTVRYSAGKPVAPVKAKIVPGKKEYQPPKPPEPSHQTQYTILKSLGIQLAFDPVAKADGTTERYEIYLVNDTKYDALYAFSIATKNLHTPKQHGKITSVSFVRLGELLFDELNDAPVVDMECWQLTTLGTGSRLHKQIKIKAQQFFKNKKTAPLLDREVHLFQVFDSFEKNTKPKKDDLQTYTAKYAQKPKQNPIYKNVNSYDPNALAHFSSEIDLHIENLVGNTSKMKNSEILRIQLSRFEAFLAQAIRLGVDRVFVIHGVGKGKLKNEIATRLINHPDVKTFKNEHHPKYGFGATEVIF